MHKKNILGTYQNIELDHKNVELIRKFISPTGRIKPRANTGITAVQQRTVARAVKRARHLALIPFVRR